MVTEYPHVFPKQLLGLPLERDIDFYIDLDPDTHPISISPNRITLAKLREFNV